MMTKEAIEHIEANTAANTAQETIQKKLMNASIGGEFQDGVLIPAGHTLTSIEKMLPQPARYRAKFTTDSTADYCAYINTNADEDTQIFIDKKTMHAVAIIDQGTKETPLWGEHTATLKLDKLPEYTDLLNGNGVKMNQDSFINFIRDHAPHITFYEEGDDTLDNVTFNDALRRLRKLNLSAYSKMIQEQGDLSANMSKNAGWEIKSGDSAAIAGFTFKTTGYDGLPTTSIDCIIQYTASEKELTISYRITAENALKELFAQNFKDALCKNITVTELAAPPVIGTMLYQQ